MTLFLPRPVARRLPRPLLDAIEWLLAGPPPVSPPLAAQPPALRKLIRVWAYEIVARLECIHAAPDPDDVQDRFLVVSLADRPGAYVQCAFDAWDRRMLCEVASGAFFDIPRTMYLPAPAIAALGRLGFSTDGSKENFRQAFRLADPPDLAAVAVLLLTALHVAFDATIADGLIFRAPYAPDTWDEEAAD